MHSIFIEGRHIAAQRQITLPANEWILWFSQRAPRRSKASSVCDQHDIPSLFFMTTSFDRLARKATSTTNQLRGTVGGGDTRIDSELVQLPFPHTTAPTGFGFTGDEGNPQRVTCFG